MVRVITFGSLKVWLFIQQLHAYSKDDLKNLPEIQEFICYFKFSEPTQIIYGELIRKPESKYPMLFNTIEEAEQYASDYLVKRFHFVKYHNT